MSDKRFDALMGFLVVAGLCAVVLEMSGNLERKSIVEFCIDHGSFVYQDVRYICEEAGLK
jgi:hypothetical protein